MDMQTFAQAHQVQFMTWIPISVFLFHYSVQASMHNSNDDTDPFLTDRPCDSVIHHYPLLHHAKFGTSRPATVSSIIIHFSITPNLVLPAPINSSSEAATHIESAGLQRVAQVFFLKSRNDEDSYQTWRLPLPYHQRGCNDDPHQSHRLVSLS
jgi:hypothetical protein